MGLGRSGQIAVAKGWSSSGPFALVPTMWWLCLSRVCETIGVPLVSESSKNPWRCGVRA